MGLIAHQVVPSSTGARVLFAGLEHHVCIGHLADNSLTPPIETTFDTGGHRLALSDEMNGILAGAYNTHGAAFYSCATGKELWRRKDVTRVQIVSLSRDGRLAYCGREGASLSVVDLVAGEIAHSIRGARSLLESPYENATLVDGAQLHLIARQKHLVERTTFATLCAAFAPGCVALSDADGPVRCLDTASGNERWRYCPPQGSHVLRLGYREQDAALVGVEWPFRNGGTKRLLQLALTDGGLLGANDIGEPVDVCFAHSSQVVVTTAGHVIDTRTGAIQSTFDDLHRWTSVRPRP